LRTERKDLFQSFDGILCYNERTDPLSSRGGLLRARGPALLLLHRHLLGDARRVLGTVPRHGVVIDGLSAKRTDGLATMKDVWRR
jgi:hypothetical protein